MLIKFKNNFDVTTKNFICDNLDDAKNKLIDYLVSEFEHLKLNFPLEFTDFEYLWLNQQYISCDMLNYKLFINNQWEEPWDLQDIYSDVIDKLMEKDMNKGFNFSEIYGEPDADESNNNNFNIENNEFNFEIEQKIQEIINNSKNIKLQEDFVKDCKCVKCVNNN